MRNMADFEKLAENFPECEKITKDEVKNKLEELFSSCECYLEMLDKFSDYCQSLWPRPDYDKEQEAWKEWSNFFIGQNFYNYRDKLIDAYIEQNGKHHTMEEAAKIVADTWTKKIFGMHWQDNGDRTGHSEKIMLLGTMLKEKCRERITDKMIQNFKEIAYWYYFDGCISDNGWYSPYGTDYSPNKYLYDALVKAGVDPDDACNICPWKTHISIDKYDNTVVVGTYQNQQYL